MAEDAAARATALADAAVAGDRLALARLLTAVENRTPVAEAALRRLYPMAGRAHLVGITGPPGAGKSTLVAALLAEVRAAGRPVAVVAVDPSSPITGGALLGDRVRMQAYADDRDVFIRSMASRGHAGGLASTTASAASVLDAAGFDLVLIETVGTGQSEVEVAAAADTTVVLEAPEMGDEVQAIKAGLLEVADLVVVNKGDKPGAQRTAAQLRAMLVPIGRARGRRTGRSPSAPRCSSRPRRPATGVPALLAALDRHRSSARDGLTNRRPATTGGGAGALDPGRPARRSTAGGRPRSTVGRGRHRGRRTPTRPVRRRRPPARGDGHGGRMTSTEPASSRPPLVTPAFLAVTAAALAFFTAGGTVLPVATRFAAGPLGADAIGVGVAIGAFAIAALALRPVVGWASDRFGRRPLLLLGGAITVVALLAHLIAGSLPAFVAVRALLGIGEAFFFVAALAAIADLSPPERRGEGINLASLSVYLGLAIGPFIGETVLAAASYDAVWLTAAAMAVLATRAFGPRRRVRSRGARGRGRTTAPRTALPPRRGPAGLPRPDRCVGDVRVLRVRRPGRDRRRDAERRDYRSPSTRSSSSASGSSSPRCPIAWDRRAWAGRPLR